MYRTVMINRFMRFVMPEPNTGCWLWMGATLRGGYGSFRINYKTRRANRVSYELFKGDVPEGMMVLHTCDVSCCVNPDHLYAGDHQKNMTDKVERGRVKGWKNSRAKLTTEQILEIRIAVGSGSEIAKKYGIAKQTVSDIKLKKKWSHIA